MTAEVSGKVDWPARLALLLLGLACVIPFLSPVFHPPVASFYGEAAAFALGLAAIALMATGSLWTDVRLPRVSLMFIGFALLMAFQAAWGKVAYAQLNLLGALYVLWAAAIAMLANRLVRSLGAAALATGLAWFLLAGSALSGLIGLIQLLGVQTPLAPFMLPHAHGRIYANTGQPNHLASYLCIGLASAGYLWSTRRLGIGSAMTLCALALVVLAASGSRAAWLYVAGLVLLALATAYLRPSQDCKRLLGFSVVLVAALLAAHWLTANLIPTPVMPLETIGARMRTDGFASPARLQFWHEAWQMFLSAPILGVGFKQFAWQHFLQGANGSGVLDPGIIDHAHNLVLHIAAEFGLPGFLVLTGGLAWWGWSLRRAQIDAAQWWFVALLGILLVHSMLEYPLWYAYFLGLAAVALGATERDAPAHHDGPGGRVILCVAVLLGAVALANVYRDYRVMQSLQRTASNDSTTASVHGDSSVRVLLDLQRNSIFSPFIDYALAGRMLLNREHLEDKIVLNARAMRFQPSNDVVYRQALLLALSGNDVGMRAHWDAAVANYPGDRERVLKLAQAMEAAGEPGMHELLTYAQQLHEKAEK